MLSPCPDSPYPRCVDRAAGKRTHCRPPHGKCPVLCVTNPAARSARHIVLPTDFYQVNKLKKNKKIEIREKFPFPNFFRPLAKCKFFSQLQKAQIVTRELIKKHTSKYLSSFNTIWAQISIWSAPVAPWHQWTSSSSPLLLPIIRDYFLL